MAGMLVLPEEVAYVVSDQHLGEGERVRMPFYSSWRGLMRAVLGLVSLEAPKDVEVENPLEDFYADKEFADFLLRAAEESREVPVVTLRLLGDVFDPMAVRFRGKLVDPPYENVAVEKMQSIMTGHPIYFDALVNFLRLPNARLDVFVGNHDLFLAWPAVHEVLRQRLADGDASLRGKIRFIDVRYNFELIERGVLYYHGHNADEGLRVDPDKTIILPEESGLKAPILNLPYGSFLVTDLVSVVKQRNILIGRADKYSEILRDAASYRWGWALLSIHAFLWSMIRHAFFAIGDVRRQGGLVQAIRMIREGFREKPVDKYALDMLVERAKQNGVRAVIMGHSHDSRRFVVKSGVYVNTGTWTRSYRLEPVQLQLSWSRWLAPLEWPLRFFEYVLVNRRLPYANVLSMILGVAGLLAVILAAVSANVRGGVELALLRPLDRWDVVGVVALAFFVAGIVVQFVAAGPKLFSTVKYTCARIRHFADAGKDEVRLVEWRPEARELVDLGDSVR